MLSRAPEMIAEARAWVRGLTQSSPALTAEDVARLSAIEDVPQQSESSAASSTIYVLDSLPCAQHERSQLRRYFIALFINQIGSIAPGVSFKLWPRHFATHIDSGRLLRNADGSYQLSNDGAAYFNDPKQRPDDELLRPFIHAVAHGKGERHPIANKSMSPL